MATEILSIPLQAAPAMHEIERGLKLNKCQKCGCMEEALQNARQAFGGSQEPELVALVPTIEDYQAKMQPIAYDCIGCKKCWGADATIQLANNFEDVEPDDCGSAGAPCAADAPVVRLQDAADKGWPPYPGDYVVGDLTGSVAVCTLSSRDLAAGIVEGGQPHVAVAGRCDTENIGVEKVVLNILANPNIRHLILCGTEAQGHRTGDAFRQLKAKGVDSKMRVLESASWRPILKNLTLLDVARFREQIEIVDLVGTTDIAEITEITRAAQECAAQALPPLEAYQSEASALNFERIRARAPQGALKLDRAGFFIVIPQRETGVILCEHYENNGRLAHVIEGKKAALIAATAVEQGLVTLLDHAVYLGRELAKAEVALQTGVEYEQDAALGDLPDGAADKAAQESDNETCRQENCCGCE